MVTETSTKITSLNRLKFNESLSKIDKRDNIEDNYYFYRYTNLMIV